MAKETPAPDFAAAIDALEELPKVPMGKVRWAIYEILGALTELSGPERRRVLWAVWILCRMPLGDDSVPYERAKEKGRG